MHRSRMDDWKLPSAHRAPLAWARWALLPGSLICAPLRAAVVAAPAQVPITTERVSVRDLTGAEANENSTGPSVSSNGNLVAFASWASNLSGVDGNQKRDVFVRDRAAGSTIRISLAAGGGD